jgi:hypothetical protein
MAFSGKNTARLELSPFDDEFPFLSGYSILLLKTVVKRQPGFMGLITSELCVLQDGGLDGMLRTVYDFFQHWPDAGLDYYFFGSSGAMCLMEITCESRILSSCRQP